MSDPIERQAAIDAPFKKFDVNTGVTWIPLEHIEQLPSVQPENTRILAEALNGSPLLYPCDKLWSREGWCKDHCKKEQIEPDTECWLKYAETITAERREE